MTRQKVEVFDGWVRVGEEIVPLISGEVHFWRIPKTNWRPVLEKVKDLGLQVVATYIAWNFHEIERGRYDFTGVVSPERDLEGFLRLTQEMGLKVMLRPGPYIYSEWPHGGPIEEATRYHRLDPRFLELAQEWIKGVSEVILPFQATRGGHVIAVQPDNEPYPAFASQGDEMGCFGQHGLFKEWISGRYGGDIKKLNAAWNANFRDFSRVALHWEEPYVNRLEIAENARLMPEPKYDTRIIDSQEFFEYYAIEIVRWTAGIYREAGIDVPFFSNGWHCYAQNFHDTLEVAQFCGFDAYPSKYFESCTYLPGQNDWDYFMEIMKVQENNCGWAYSPELACGIWEDALFSKEDLTPHSVAFANRSLMANGLKAWNWYMIVGRDFWYHSAIDQFGRGTSYFEPHKKVVDLANAIELHTLRRMPDASLVTLRRQRLTDSGNWQCLFDSITETGMDFELVDSRYSAPKCDMIFYGGSNFIEEDEIPSLKKAVEDGATLVVFNRAPVENRSGEVLNPFDLMEPDGQRPIMSPYSILWQDQAFTIPQCGHLGKCWTLYFASEPEGATPIYAAPLAANVETLVDIKTSESSLNTYVMGYVKPLGKGKIVHFGASPNELAIRIAKDIAGLRGKVETHTSGTAVTMWENDQARYVFLINRNRHGVLAELSIDRGVYPDAASLKNVESGDEARIDESGRAYIKVAGHEVAVFAL